MKRYVQSSRPGTRPQILRAEIRGKAYSVDILRAEEEHYAAPLRPSDSSPHRHGVYHLVAYLDGEDRFMLDGIQHPARRGVVVVTSPAEAHRFAPCGGGTLTSYELTFVLAGDCDRTRSDMPVHTFLSALSGLRLPHVPMPAMLEEPELRQLMALYEDLLVALNSMEHARWVAADHLMLQILLLLVREVYLGGKREMATPVDPLELARIHLEQNFSERISIGDLAARSGLSPSHLSHEFRRRFGCPPIAFQQSRRIRAAQSLLRASPLSVSEIAARVGYPDVYALSRMFKRRVGVSPSTFRKQQEASVDASGVHSDVQA